MSLEHSPSVVFLMGPTCAGKTAVAMDLVERLPCEIVSVDSAMIYRGMDIGTAKPSRAELTRAPHRLIDIRDPAESYSAAEFRTDALAAIQTITATGKIPLLVGGTGLYFRALERGLSPLPAADPQVRARLQREAERLGWKVLHQRLTAIDMEAASRIHPNDPQRIQRALEIFELTGKSITQWWTAGRSAALPFRVLKLVLSPRERGELHRRARDRFQRMLAAGFIEEVRALYQRGDLHPDLPSMRVVGYRQAWQYLRGACNYETMVTEAIAATRQLAKRQLTWLRANAEADWIDAGLPGLSNLVVRTLQQKLDGESNG